MSNNIIFIQSPTVLLVTAFPFKVSYYELYTAGPQLKPKMYFILNVKNLDKPVSIQQLLHKVSVAQELQLTFYDWKKEKEIHITTFLLSSY